MKKLFGLAVLSVLVMLAVPAAAQEKVGATDTRTAAVNATHRIRQTTTRALRTSSLTQFQAPNSGAEEF